jgi:putative ABC transport system permease protein
LLLLAIEGVGIIGLALLLGALLATLGVLLAGPWLAAHYGLWLTPGWPTAGQGLWLAAVAGVGVLASLWPAWRAYRMALSDGLTPHV